MTKRYILAFDTANETVAVGIGRVSDASAASACAADSADAPLPGQACARRRIEFVCGRERAAHRASNTVLVEELDAALAQAGVEKSQIAAVVCGRGPGSFTGVRICMATAKGAACALEVPLYGVSTLDAVAWGAHAAGARGRVAVVADAMRKEVYPAVFDLSDAGIERLSADAVVKAVECAPLLQEAAGAEGLSLCGDALVKYRDLFEECGAVLGEQTWQPTGYGLIAAADAAFAAGAMDLSDAAWHGVSPKQAPLPGDPGVLLPVYTRLSDAEENERIRLAKGTAGAMAGADLSTGVQDPRAMEAAAAGESVLEFRPLDAAHAAAVADLEARSMGNDAWSAALVADELGRKDRSWWMACDGDVLAGYCGGWVVDGDVQILKVATEPAYRRRGIARQLMSLVASDARDLGAQTCSLEVRASNEGAQAFYETAGLFSVGVRPGYYPDREDAVIMSGPLPLGAASDASSPGVAGMELIVNQEDEQAVSEREHPLIFAIESSCDETAAAIIDGRRRLLSDVVASQIDFHSRFGGVVPEIASRKHIEAICGVAGECLDSAAKSLGAKRLRWRDLDAVAVTYAPGLVGALVVGVAFAKGAAWGADLPLIAVNHLEGHLYANRIATPDICPPMVVSLVSGGHTMLVHVKDWGDYETLGSTIDDAVGEAFDKVAKALGLGYPGGPVISRLAAQGNPKAIDFPRALMHSGDLRFSLSGLKTAVTFYIQKQKDAGVELNMPDIAASFQQAVIDVQVAKAKTALLETGAKEFCLGGGVAANPALRAAYEKMCSKIGVRLTMPPMSACTDNAAMIAEVAHDRFEQGKFADRSLDVKAHAPLDEAY